MSTPKRTERWKGIEFKLEGHRITRARYKDGYPQKWHPIPERYYGSRQECLAYKETQKLVVPRTLRPDSKITFGEYVEKFLARKSLKIGTERHYRYRLYSDAIGP